MRAWVGALTLLCVGCTGDRAEISDTFEVCPVLVDGSGAPLSDPAPGLRALGVWSTELAYEVAFDVAVGACGAGRSPSAALVAQVPADDWVDVYSWRFWPLRVVLVDDVDRSGGYTPQLDRPVGEGTSAPLAYWAQVRGAEPGALPGYYLARPLSPMARLERRPEDLELVPRAWSPRVDLTLNGAGACPAPYDVRLCPYLRGFDLETAAPLVAVHPAVARAPAGCEDCVEAEGTPPSEYVWIGRCLRWGAAEITAWLADRYSADDCRCTLRQQVWYRVVPEADRPEGWPCEETTEASARLAEYLGLAPIVP